MTSYITASSEMFDFVENAKEDCGPDVDTKLAQVVNKFVREKLPMHKLSSIEERNIMAGNVDVGVPKTNIELWKQLGRSAQDKDKILQKLQQFVVSGLKPIIQASDLLVRKIDEETGLSPVETKEVLTKLIDALCICST
ncbi:hypothetical protein ElyMa_006567900 [Elysia marginata]|uniref:Uncharacterized protein n=1 Tax=Elysia marginata TaxID=1093978 RepID=A0AAV4IBB2_9GAST|nr:hypothetical protein ElyMa_006567900 [Elysia marginata]